MRVRRGLSILLAGVAVVGVSGTAHASSPEPAGRSTVTVQVAGHPVRCTVTASRPKHIGTHVTATGKVQCSEAMKGMRAIMELQRPDGHSERFTPPSAYNTSVFGYTTSIDYAGRGRYENKTWGFASPKPNQDNGINSSALNAANL